MRIFHFEQAYFQLLYYRLFDFCTCKLFFVWQWWHFKVFEAVMPSEKKNILNSQTFSLNFFFDLHIPTQTCLFYILRFTSLTKVRQCSNLGLTQVFRIRVQLIEKRIQFLILMKYYIHIPNKNERNFFLLYLVVTALVKILKEV